MPDGGGYNHKSSNNAGSCTYVCFDPAEVMRVEGYRQNQREKCPDDI